jgi:MFS family permease
VLTLTITGISADSTPAGGSGSKLGRRLLSVLSLFLGGVAGALLIIRSGDAPWVLLIAVVLLGAITAAAATTRRSVAAWTHQR